MVAKQERFWLLDFFYDHELNEREKERGFWTKLENSKVKGVRSLDTNVQSVEGDIIVCKTHKNK